ncbi:hypothetical protein TNCV_1870141 [Trichonephila clavipes]|nr:hypothetical protein TNCV_1870141 [Trichonephila clavipes]
MVCHAQSLAPNPWRSGRRRIGEADISTPVTVNQRAANCLEEAVGSFTAMWRAGVDRRVLALPSVVYYQFFELFGVRRSTAFQTHITVELFRCTRAPIA